jgi:hypothetical protein
MRARAGALCWLPAAKVGANGWRRVALNSKSVAYLAEKLELKNLGR